MSRRKHNQSDNTRATISSRKTGKENNASEDAKAHSREARQRRKGVNQGRNKQLNNRMTENTLISSKSYQLTVHMKLFSTSVSKLSTPLSSGSTNPCPTEDKTKDVREWTVNTPPSDPAGFASGLEGGALTSNIGAINSDFSNHSGRIYLDQFSVQYLTSQHERQHLSQTTATHHLVH